MSVISKVLALIGLPLVVYGMSVAIPAQSQSGNSIGSSIQDTESSEIIITAEDPLILLPPLTPPSVNTGFLIPGLVETELDSINNITPSLLSYGLYPSAGSVLESVKRVEENISITNQFEELDPSFVRAPQPVLLMPNTMNSTVLVKDGSDNLSQDFQPIQIDSYLLAHKSILSAGALVNSRAASIDASLLAKTIFPISFGYPYRIITEADIQNRVLFLQIAAAYHDSYTWKTFSSIAESRLAFSVYQLPAELTIKGVVRSDFLSHIPFFVTAKSLLGGLNVGETNGVKLSTNIGTSFWNTLTSIDWNVFFSGKFILDRSLPNFGSEFGGKLQISSNDSIMILPVFSLVTIVIPGLQAKIEFEPLLETPDWFSKDLSLTILHSDEDKNANMHKVQALAPERGWSLSGTLSYAGNYSDKLVSVVTLMLGVNSGYLYRLEPEKVIFSEVNAVKIDMATELFFDGNMNFYSNKLLLQIGMVTDLKSKTSPRMKLESTWPLNKLLGLNFRAFGSLAAPPVYSNEFIDLTPLEDLFGLVVACAVSWRGQSGSEIEVSVGFRRAWESNMYSFIGINYSSD